MLAAVLGLAHAAQAESEISTKAEYRVRGAISQGTDFQDDSTENGVKHRFKLLTEYKANDKVSAQLTLVHNASWGTSDVFAGAGGLSTDRSDLNPNNGTNNNLSNDTGIIVNEAYATWRLSDEFTLKIGRGSFEGGIGTSIAVNDFQDVMTAFDGFAGIYETDFARITGYMIKFADFNFGAANGSVSGSSSPRTDAEANTVGVNADFKFAPELFQFFNVGLNQVRRDQYNIAGSPLLTRPKESYLKYSISAGILVAEMFNFRAAYSGTSGERSTDDGTVDGDITSSMIDVEAGIQMEDTMNLKFSVGYHMDSGTSNPDPAGDDETYQSYYYDIHRYAGLMDVVQWGNLSYISVKASMEPMEDLTLGIQYHMFTATEEDDGTFLVGRTTGSVGAGASDEIGNEIDLYATHSYDNGLSLTARYGLFMAGDRMDAFAAAESGGAIDSAEDYQTFFLQGTFSF